MEVTELIAALRSGDLEAQIQALQRASEISQALTTEAVNVLVASTARLPIAEQLLRFGIIMRPLLEELLTKPVDDEAKTHASAVLFELGSRAGLGHLRSVLEKEGKDSLIAANYLGKAHDAEAHRYIERILRRLDVRTDPYTASALITDLKRTGGIPEDLREKLLQELPVAWRPMLEETE